MPEEVAKKYLEKLREPLLLVKDKKISLAQDIFRPISEEFFREQFKNIENKEDDLDILSIFTSLDEFFNNCPSTNEQDVFNKYNELIFKFFNKKA